MKKYFLFFLTICLMFTMKVNAVNIGPATNDDGSAFAVGESNTVIGIKNGVNGYIQVSYEYNEFFGYLEDQDLGKLEVTTSVPSGVNLSIDRKDVESPDTFSGNASSYTVVVNNTGEDIDGSVTTKLVFPTKNVTSEYTINVTAKAYDKNNSLKKTYTSKIKYIVFVKPTNCDNNYDVTVTTTGGNPTKVDGLITMYTLKTTVDNIEITFTPASSKTKVSSVQNVFGEGKKPLTNNKTGSFKLEYGETELVYFIDSECSLLGEDIYNKYATINYIVGGFNIDDIIERSDVIEVLITKDDNRSKVNTLKELSISNVKIDFKPELKNYMAEVPYSVEEVEIKSALTDSKSSYVKDFGNRKVKLNEGKNEVLVKVKAENGAEAVYTINITRKANNDASLKELKVNSEAIELAVNTYKYSYTVDNEVTNVTVEAVPNDSKATLEIKNVEELQEGSNIIEITITASDGTKQIYEVDVIRDKLISSNASIKKLGVKNHDIKFLKDKLDYEVELSKEEDKLDLEIELDNEKAKYIVSGNKDLKNGSLVKIKVTAEDESTKTYSIRIIKEEESFNKILLIPIILIPLLIGVIILLINKSKKKKQSVNTLGEIPNDDNNVFSSVENTEDTTNSNINNN